jgi:hypothetical protein
MNVFRNRWLLFSFLLYAGSLAVLWRNPMFELGETIFVFVLFVVVFPILAWVATIRAQRLPFDHQPSGREMATLVLYFVGLSLYLIGGPQFIDGLLPAAWVSDERIKFFVALAKKLIVFVFIPYALFRSFFNCSLKDFGLSREGLRQLCKSHLPVVITLSAAIIVFQYFSGARPRRFGKASSVHIN